MADAYSVVDNGSSSRVKKTTDHSVTANWIGHQCNSLCTIVSEGTNAATGTTQGWNPFREERMTAPSSIIDNFFLRDLVAARRQKRQLVIESLSSSSCRLGQKEKSEEEQAGLIVQALLGQHWDLVDNCHQE